MIAVLMVMVTLSLIVSYIRELYIHFRRPDDFDRLVTSKMRGELGGPELSKGARLAWGYPFMIAGFIVVSLASIWDVVGHG